MVFGLCVCVLHAWIEGSTWRDCKECKRNEKKQQSINIENEKNVLILKCVYPLRNYRLFNFFKNQQALLHAKKTMNDSYNHDTYNSNSKSKEESEESNESNESSENSNEKKKDVITMNDMYDKRLQNLNRNKIIVIGAGISGLACARELMNYGFDVIVLEARNRTGLYYISLSLFVCICVCLRVWDVIKDSKKKKNIGFLRFFQTWK